MSKVHVDRYKRRHPIPEITKTEAEQVKVAEAGLRKLEKLGADDHMEDVCYFEISDERSRVVPNAGTAFRRGHCTVVNLEHADVQDEVEAATTEYHEALHAHDVAVSGEEGISTEAEIDAHWRTIEFLKMWKEREPSKAKRLDQEIEEEKESIMYLEGHP